MDNETWVLEAGDKVIQKKARIGFERLATWERLVYSLWVADYGMRYAGSLDTAKEVYADFQSVALQTAETLSLPVTRGAFALAQEVLEGEYFRLFEAVCDEIRSANRGTAADRGRDPCS